MRRREFITLASSAAIVWPLAARAEQPGNPARIGFLGPGSASSWQGRIEALRAGLRDTGYVEGKDFVIEFRWADGKYDRLPELAAELVRSKVDVLVTYGAPGTLAAKRATTMIPIVMAVIGDALENGVVDNLAHPGGNVTGSSYFMAELSAKRLELLKEAIPSIAETAVLLNPDNPGSGPAARAMETMGRSLKMALQPFEAHNTDDLIRAFSQIESKRTDALAVVDDGNLVGDAARIAEFALRNRLPSIGFAEYARAGGLLGYGANLLEAYRHAAYFLDRVLKGANPGDVPVEQPTKFEFVINLKSAKALSLEIPPSLLARADEVIE